MDETGPVPEPADVIKGLRDRVCSVAPAEIGVSPSEETPNVWGVLMETTYPGALVTLVALADGTTSLYFGHGGGILGGGDHESIRSASTSFIAAAEYYHEQLAPTESFPLPDIGRVRFYALTFSGPLTAEASEVELGEGRHQLSDLFYAGHAVLAELRHIDEQWEE